MASGSAVPKISIEMVDEPALAAVTSAERQKVGGELAVHPAGTYTSLKKLIGWSRRILGKILFDISMLSKDA